VYFIASTVKIATKDSRSILGIISICFPTDLHGSFMSFNALLATINHEL
jgi:hypothetical protein